MNSTRRHRPRLSSEQLEQRVVLDGGGFLGLLLAGLAPDSQLGDDPHVDSIGADASPLEFVDGTHARVDSFIDSAGDIDVFQFAATGATLRIAGLLVEGESDVHVVDEAGDNVVGFDQTEPRDGFIQCDWVDFGFCDVFPTSPGETYFVTIGGHRVETSEYYFEFFQHPLQPTAVEPDSQPGDDPHPDRVGAAATVLEFDEENAHVTVNSFIDQPGDVDVFQFRATGDWANVRALPLDDNLNLFLHVLNSAGEIIASNVNNDGVGIRLERFVEALTDAGERYFLRVAARDGQSGQYLLDIVHGNVDVEPQPLGNPDSQLGDDPHVDAVGPDASEIRFDDSDPSQSVATIDSFIDTAGDVDVFQFVATGARARFSAHSFDGSFNVRLRLMDQSGQVLAASGADFNAPAVAPGTYIESALAPGTLYFLSVRADNVAGADDATIGEYVMEIVQERFAADPLPVRNPDARLGDDVHADEIGADATPLAFAFLVSQATGVLDSQEIVATVDSYLDEADDVDAFRFMSHHSSVTISAYSWFDALDFSVELYDSRRNLIARSEVHAADPTGAEAFANLSLSLNAGESYYVTVAGMGKATGEYVLNVLQAHTEHVTPSGDNADSEQGDDPHADVVGTDASKLALDHSGGTSVNSFIDAAGDVDVFQFTGTGGFALAVALNLSQRNALSVRVFDADGREVDATAAVGGLANAAGIRTWSTAVGQTYYVEVTARDDSAGRYVFELFAETPQEDSNAVVDGFNRALARLPDVPGSNDRIGGIGDANLDGSVDAMDFNAWNQHRFQYVWGPRNGDFNGDGVADATDFNIWNNNRFTRAAAADDDSGSARIPKAAAGSRLGSPTHSARGTSDLPSEPASIARPNVRPVRSAQLTTRIASLAAPATHSIDFVMGHVSADQVTVDMRDWTGNRRPRRETSTAVRASTAPPQTDSMMDKPCAEELVDKLFSDLGRIRF